MILEAPLATPAPDLVMPAGHIPHEPVEAPGDATYGWEMFVAFTAAVVGISIVVAVLALIGSWLMLGIAMVVHVAVTATMMRLVLGAFGSEDHAYPDMRQAEAASRAAIANAKSGAGKARARLALEA